MKNLPKWPALLVIGEPVTEEQAAEIIIRTQDFFFHTNDRQFHDDLNEVVGITDDYDFDKTDALCKEYKCLEIEFLVNSRIVSNYIGGPHGWCDWRGDIYSSSYNIGKHPSIEEVLAEWKAIATAFPFLKLKSQLFDGEQCEDSTKPVIQFNIADGNAEIATIEALGKVHDFPFSPHMFERERGCTIDKFKWALGITLIKTKLCS